MTEHNNPPAFPALAHWDRSSQMSTALQFSGMTILDHFAGLAMQGDLNNRSNLDADIVAKRAYAMADAMLKERSKWIK